MKFRPIPDPVLTPYRRKKPEPKSLVQIVLPRPQPVPQPPSTQKPAGNEPETKSNPKPDNPPKQRENLKKAGNEAAPKGKQQVRMPPVVVLEDGTVVPQPFRAVDPLTALASPDPALAFVMLRQLRDMQGPMPDTSGGALEVIEKLETDLKAGKDVTALTDEISSYIMGDDANIELYMRLHDAHDLERSREFDKSIAKWEDFCNGCMRRSDLTVVEGMAVISYIHDQQRSIFSRIDRKRSKGDAAISRDSHELVERINRPTLIQNKQLQQKFDEASPQEREMLRKLGFKLENALAARITTTTETQTVEIVQANEGIPVV